MKSRNGAFISTREMAMLLGLTRQTVRNWFLKGNLKAFKIGQSIKIPKAEAVRVLKLYGQPIPEWLNAESEPPFADRGRRRN